MTSDKKLLLYGNTPWQPVLRELCLVAESGDERAQKAAPRLAHALLSMAGETGFDGNLVHDFLTRILVSSENSYTLSAELGDEPAGTARDMALADLRIFFALFQLNLSALAEQGGLPSLAALADYRADAAEGRVYSKAVRDRICSLARELGASESAEEMLDALNAFYTHCGVGALGLHKAFRIEAKSHRAKIVPIAQMAEVRFDDLVGYDSAKQALIRNTEAFLAGAPANNCLLYGDAGTGKSSSIKALANAYYDRGLRIIEINRYEFRYLSVVMGELRHRNYRFILYMDDLSFEEFETEYKYLKAVIEGGLEQRPGNVLIYATSNRRHLIRESFGDKAQLSDDDVHRSDTVQEKLSLYDRFGLTIYFGAPAPEEYREIVRVLAAREGITMPERELLEEANRWELKHAGYSGRTARQFIDALIGERQLTERTKEE